MNKGSNKKQATEGWVLAIMDGIFKWPNRRTEMSCRALRTNKLME